MKKHVVNHYHITIGSLFLTLLASLLVIFCYGCLIICMEACLIHDVFVI